MKTIMNSLRYILCVSFLLLTTTALKAANPFLPLWEYIPDGEPYVFEDPDKPGEYRVYIYGSHDSRITDYCGLELVVWSAAINDLNNWRYDGVIFESKTDANGELLNEGGVGDVLFAPDVTMTVDANGKKTYYLFPNNQAGGRNGMAAKADRPDGPFQVINWSKTNPRVNDGVFGFDPAVFVDDDGRVYGYWGFERSYAAELDPTTMATVKPGTEIVEDMVSGRYQEGVYRFFEASSMRKIKDKYIFIYSRFTEDGEFGLPTTNYTLAYAYGDNPLGPFTYGGTIIDGRARGENECGEVVATATIGGNTHGSIAEINNQWYVFYHRQSGLNEYARQAMVEPIRIEVEEGPGGKVTISEAEYTSEGFEIDGLNLYKRYPAAIACFYMGPTPIVQEYPNFYHSGSYMQPFYLNGKTYDDPYQLDVNCNPVVNNTDGSIVGYKYFNFDGLKAGKTSLDINLKPLGVDGKIDVMIDSPWESKGGKKIGSLSIAKDMPQEAQDVQIALSDLSEYKGKHAIYLLFSAQEPTQSLCELYNFTFVTDNDSRSTIIVFALVAALLLFAALLGKRKKK